MIAAIPLSIGVVLGRGDLSEERREEVRNALVVGEQPVSEVMVPREEIIALSTEATVEENPERMVGQPHVRYPFIEANSKIPDEAWQ